MSFDEDEAHLAEVNVHLAGSVGADRREPVLRLVPVTDVLELLAVAREEHSARARAVSDAYDVALYVFGPVGIRMEGLVVPACAVGNVGHGVLMEAWRG